MCNGERSRFNGKWKEKEENEKDNTGEKEREVTPSRIAYGGAP